MFYKKSVSTSVKTFRRVLGKRSSSLDHFYQLFDSFRRIRSSFKHFSSTSTSFIDLHPANRRRQIQNISQEGFIFNKSNDGTTYLQTPRLSPITTARHVAVGCSCGAERPLEKADGRRERKI